ncbi:hypothetical protein [Nonomuraea glycinis]|uniref:hypothetical protein n=1 Tax=Nonomuraea glycinis TaxID=2047744 RepID=UPI002E13AC33|nr:hypothetical protein OHA68_15275 [Nonomuraea glycinis]
MGRHRSAPMGLARLALAVLAAGAVVTLLVIGGRALFASAGGEQVPVREPFSGSPTGGSGVPVPTLRIECVADTCPLVTVRVPGGDVLQHRDMSRGEEVSYFEPELDVVLSDAGTVRVTENGERRPQGEPGGRESFTTRGPAG